jgi:hypothetical protein
LPNPPCQLSLWEETGVPGGTTKNDASYTKYNAEIKYAPEKDIQVADALSIRSSYYGNTVEGLYATEHA